MRESRDLKGDAVENSLAVSSEAEQNFTFSSLPSHLPIGHMRDHAELEPVTTLELRAIRHQA